jgi:non-ribosomal peptide synthetase component E (peptide arylation enzyme)
MIDMRIADPPIAAKRIAEFVAAGYWREPTSNDALEHLARLTPDKAAIVDQRGRRTPTGKVQKTPLRQIAIDKLGSRLPPAQSRAGREYQW